MTEDEIQAKINEIRNNDLSEIETVEIHYDINNFTDLDSVNDEDESNKIKESIETTELKNNIIQVFWSAICFVKADNIITHIIRH